VNPITNPLTDEERSRIKHFLQYPDWSALAASIHLGFPASSQPMYLVEGAFDRLTQSGVDSARKDLCECESIEAQLSGARGRMKATQLGNLKVNPQESMQLRQELVWWSLVLANDLGVGPNPFSAMQFLGGGSGRNASVVG
jgi:hypothetical protein